MKKQLIGETLSGTLYRVDGNEVRQIDVDFALGKHYLLASYIPDREIWVEEMLHKEDECATSVHEIIEAFLMQEKMAYDRAHEIASAFERVVRSVVSQCGILEELVR